MNQFKIKCIKLSGISHLMQTELSYLFNAEWMKIKHFSSTYVLDLD